MKNVPLVFIWDHDGTQVNSMGPLMDLGIACVKQHFPRVVNSRKPSFDNLLDRLYPTVDPVMRKACINDFKDNNKKNEYIAFSRRTIEYFIQYFGLPTGDPFKKLLNAIIPDASAHEIDTCLSDFNERLMLIQGKISNFPDTLQTIQHLNKMDIAQVIVSAESKSILRSWVKRYSIEGAFSDMFGYEHGTKQQHLEVIRRKYPNALLMMVSDSPGDMRIVRDMQNTFGIGFVPKYQKQIYPKPKVLQFPEIEKDPAYQRSKWIYRSSGATQVIPKLQLLTPIVSLQLRLIHMKG